MAISKVSDEHGRLVFLFTDALTHTKVEIINWSHLKHLGQKQTPFFTFIDNIAWLKPNKMADFRKTAIHFCIKIYTLGP